MKIDIRLLGLVFAVSQNALAMDWTGNFSSVNYLQYYSNPLFLSNPQGVSVADWTPGYAVTGQNDLYTVKAQGSVNLLKSSNPGLMVNRADPTAVIFAGYNGATSRLNLTLNYSQVTTLPMGISPIQSGQYSNATVDATRISRSAAMEWQKDFNERYSLDTTATLSAVDFSQPGSVQNTYSLFPLMSYTEEQLSSKLSRQILPTLTSYVLANGGEMKPSSGTGQNSWYGVNLGSKWNISDAWLIDAYAGLSKVDNNVPGLTYISTGSQTGFSGSVDAEWARDNDSFSLIARQVFQGSAYGGITESDVLSSAFVKQLSDRNFGGADLLYSKTLTIYLARQTMIDAWVSHHISNGFDLKLMLQRIQWMPSGLGALTNNVMGLYLTYSDQ